MQAKRGSILIIVIVLVVLILALAVVFLYPRFFQKSSPKNETSTEQIQPKTEYENPFDKKTQYVNPFSQYKNPFDNLK